MQDEVNYQERLTRDMNDHSNRASPRFQSKRSSAISTCVSLPKRLKFFPYNTAFLLIKNTTFRAIEQANQIIFFCALSSTSQLNTLHLDSLFLLSILCGISAIAKLLNFYDFDGNVITIRQLATGERMSYLLFF